MKPGRKRRLERRGRMVRERLERRRAKSEEMRRALWARLDAVNQEETAKGVPEATMRERFHRALRYLATSGSGVPEEFVVLNTFRLLRGQDLAERRGAKSERPRSKRPTLRRT